MRQERKHMMQGALILLIANVLVKCIGALFKIPLLNLIGEESFGVFMSAYNIYAFFFVIATAGLPVAVSKMLAESYALRRFSEAKKIFKVVFTTFFTLGALCTAALLFFSDFFARSVENPASTYAVMTVAPAVLFSVCMATYRGYFQGEGNMLPTAVSQVIEAVCKLVIGFLAAYYLLNLGKDMPVVVAGAISGVSAGTLFGALALAMFKAVRKKPPHERMPKTAESSDGASSFTILKRLLRIALPITIGTSVVSFSALIDNFVVLNRLKYMFSELFTGKSFYDIYLTVHDALPRFSAVAASVFADERIVSTTQAVDSLANKIWGAYSGMAMNLYTLPAGLITALSISVIPFIAGAYVKKDFDTVRSNTMASLRIVAMFTLPVSAGLFVLARPVLQILYSSKPVGVDIAAPLLQDLSIGIVFLCMVSLSGALLQAIGRVNVPLVTMLIGGTVKFLLSYFLMSNPLVNMSAVPFATTVCYGLIALLNLIVLTRELKLSVKEYLPLIKPLFAALLMGMSLYLLYGTVLFRLGLIPSVIVAVAAGGILYLVLLFVLRFITESDLLLLPKGELLVKKLKKFL